MSTTTPAPGAPRAPRAPAARGVLATEVRLFAREPGAFFWILVFPSALLGILGLIPSFREPDAELGGQSVADLYVPVAVLLSAIMASIQSMPHSLTSYRERGILRRLRATPVHPGALLRAQVVVHAVAIVAGSLLAVALGRLAFGTPLPQDPVAWLLAFVLAVAASLSIGAVVAAVSPTTKVSTTVGTVVFFPMMFTAGVWLPVQTMTGWLQDVVVLTPLGAAARALNDAATGDWPRLVDLLVTGGWTVALTLVAVRTFRWE